MARKIAYIGFGHLGEQLSLLLHQTAGEDLEEIFFDDIAVEEKRPGAYPFIAHTDEAFSRYEFFITLGYKQLEVKNKILASLLNTNRMLPAYIHPSCIVNPTAVIKPGCILYPGCNIDQQVTLQEGVFLNNSVTVCHDTVIHESTFIAPGAVICGNVTIGRECFIGAGAIISNGVIIGDAVSAGIGSVITNHVPPGVSVIGNPARELTTKITLR